ncbi:MAG: SMP-30/gluconolactonase/LRE family protein [Chloroflexota bacterium]
MTKKFEVYDNRFLELLRPDSELKQLWTGARWSEGPVYFTEGDYVTWSDIHNNRMLRWSDKDGMSIFRQPSNFSNGHYRDLQGRLVSCEHGGRRVTRTEADGSVVVLVDSYRGKKLNSPNDVIVKSDGTIWFTDPPYGIIQPGEGYLAESELGINYVFRFDPTTHDLTPVVDDMDKPNGLAFSPDEGILYVADSGFSHDPNGPHHIRAYDVIDGKTLINGRVFAVIEPGVPDGFRLDKHGYLFISSQDSVQVYSPAGELLGKIMVPEIIANLTFGGPNKDRLFIAANSSLYSIMLNTNGIQKP